MYRRELGNSVMAEHAAAATSGKNKGAGNART